MKISKDEARSRLLPYGFAAIISLFIAISVTPSVAGKIMMWMSGIIGGFFIIMIIAATTKE
jgi:hypothetical protein